MESVADLHSHLVESMNSIQTIKRFGLEDFSNSKTEKLYVRMMQNVSKNVIGGIYIERCISFVSLGITIAVLWLGSSFVIDANLTPGKFIMFYALTSYIITPIVELIGANTSIQDTIVASERLFQIMNLEKEEKNTSKIELTSNMVGDITFNNVSFRYGIQRNVFTDLNLTIKHSEITAIIGDSGSGKTTLAALLQKIYTINIGEIKIGTYNIKNLTNKSLRRVISTVPQSIKLFTGTIAENIAIGEHAPNYNRIGELIRLLGLEHMIKKMPNGIYSKIGEHGATLSGGERQRIAIARSLYRNPKILILDEATSSLDNATENLVNNLLRTLVNEGMTIIIITHKIASAYKIADKVIVLKNGCAEES